MHNNVSIIDLNYSHSVDDNPFADNINLLARFFTHNTYKGERVTVSRFNHIQSNKLKDTDKEVIHDSRWLVIMNESDQDMTLPEMEWRLQIYNLIPDYKGQIIIANFDGLGVITPMDYLRKYYPLTDLDIEFPYETKYLQGDSILGNLYTLTYGIDHDVNAHKSDEPVLIPNYHGTSAERQFVDILKNDGVKIDTIGGLRDREARKVLDDYRFTIFIGNETNKDYYKMWSANSLALMVENELTMENADAMAHQCEVQIKSINSDKSDELFHMMSVNQHQLLKGVDYLMDFNRIANALGMYYKE